MSRVFKQLIAAAIVLVSMQSVSLSAQEPQMASEVQAWFTALTKVNHPGFSRLIAEDAKIELRDLGIVQNRREFLDSLLAWEDATKGAILMTQLLSTGKGVNVLEVCYRFENNEQLNRETYHYENGKITAVIQEQLGTRCKGF